MEISLILGISLLSLLFAFYLALSVLKNDPGTPAMQEIANAIKEGAEAFLRRQYKTIIIPWRNIKINVKTYVNFDSGRSRNRQDIYSKSYNEIDARWRSRPCIKPYSSRN